MVPWAGGRWGAARLGASTKGLWESSHLTGSGDQYSCPSISCLLSWTVLAAMLTFYLSLRPPCLSGGSLAGVCDPRLDVRVGPKAALLFFHSNRSGSKDKTQPFLQSLEACWGKPASQPRLSYPASLGPCSDSHRLSYLSDPDCL